MGISEDLAYEIISPHFYPLWQAISGAVTECRTYPNQTVHGKLARAVITNDLIFRNVVQEFDEVPGIMPIVREPEHMRFLSMEGGVLLWFKKVDELRQTANFPTPQAVLRNSGQAEMFGKQEILVAGYRLNREENGVDSITFCPPNDVSPRWWFDIVGQTKVIEMSRPQLVVPEDTPRIEIQIIRCPKQINLV